MSDTIYWTQAASSGKWHARYAHHERCIVHFCGVRLSDWKSTTDTPLKSDACHRCAKKVESIWAKEGDA